MFRSPFFFALLGCFAVACEDQGALVGAGEAVSSEVFVADVESGGAAQCQVTAGTYDLTVPGFEDRSARVHVPQDAGLMDAVVMLHGGSQDGATAAAITRFDEAAADRSMIAVFPDGLDGMWRAGTTDEMTQEMLGDVDDVGYLSALSDTLRSQLCVGRVLGAGFSVGSMMVQRWACEGWGVDAIVGSGGTRIEHTCAAEPLPVFYVHGLLDARIPYDGTPSPVTGRTWPSVSSTLDLWLDHDGWDGEEPQSEVDGGLVCETFAGVEPVRHCSLAGLGHRWPGGRNARERFDLTADSLDWFVALEAGR